MNGKSLKIDQNLDRFHIWPGWMDTNLDRFLMGFLLGCRLSVAPGSRKTIQKQTHHSKNNSVMLVWCRMWRRRYLWCPNSSDPKITQNGSRLYQKLTQILGFRFWASNPDSHVPVSWGLSCSCLCDVSRWEIPKFLEKSPKKINFRQGLGVEYRGTLRVSHQK